MKLNLSWILILLFFTINCAQSANILFYFGLASYSHRISVWPLVTALADRGHNVTFATTTYPKEAHKHPNVREFLPKAYFDKLSADPVFDESKVIEERINNGRFQGGGVDLPNMGLKICEGFLTTKETQDWIEHSKFDLVVIDGLFNDCGYGLAYKFKAKTILFGTSIMFSWWYEPFGIPNEASWISDAIVSFPTPMTFFQRLITNFMIPVTYFYKVWMFYPQLTELLRTELKSPDMPDVATLEQQTSLILTNSHFSEEFARSLPPLVVSVGGLHILEPKKQNVPADMLKFMDESGDAGFFYVSFGSVTKISQAPVQVQQMFIEAFKNIKARILWKWELERPKELSSNVMTSDWMPQQFILSHPKIKGFVTHGGLMSLTEAVINGVPVLMFPMFAEQDFNAYRFETFERGVRLDIATANAEDLQKAFHELQANSKYKRNMMKAKELYNDRPQTPLQTAVWWTEYVLRHDDLTVLKPLSMHQTWYQRRLLDVWAFLAGSVLLTLFIIFYVIKKLVCCIFCRDSSSKSSTKKKSGSKVKKS